MIDWNVDIWVLRHIEYSIRCYSIFGRQKFQGDIKWTCKRFKSVKFDQWILARFCPFPEVVAKFHIKVWMCLSEEQGQVEMQSINNRIVIEG